VSAHVVAAEVIDRVLLDDGWSVQLDHLTLEGGQRQYRVYVFPDQGDSLAWELGVGSIHEGLREMGWFLGYCREVDTRLGEDADNG
jgi:hypothetical protein